MENNEQNITDVELAEQFLANSNQTKENPEQKLQQAEIEMQNWYEKDFLPYKAAKEQEQKDFHEFQKIIKNNPYEVKHMLASIYEYDFEEVVNTWNYLKLDPQIEKIELVDDNLVITDVDDDINEINFDSLLDKIDMVLGG